MPRRALILQHVSVNPPGIWGEALDAAGVEVDVVRSDLDGPPRDHAGYDLIVSLGGPQSLLATDADPWLVDEARLIGNAVQSGVPFLGICLGAQLLARALGGTSLPGDTFELGVVPVRVRRAAASDPLFGPLRPELLTYAYHRDTFTLPSGAVHLASSEAYANQAFRWGPLAYGLQFHLEPTVAAIERWLSLTPRADVDAAGGAAACLDAYACAEPALRDAAAGITQRWLTTIRRERHAEAPRMARPRRPRLRELRPRTT
jgi:GMP synthase-like glutamine amidotransferase